MNDYQIMLLQERILGAEVTRLESAYDVVCSLEDDDRLTKEERTRLYAVGAGLYDVITSMDSRLKEKRRRIMDVLGDIQTVSRKDKETYAMKQESNEGTVME